MTDLTRRFFSAGTKLRWMPLLVSTPCPSYSMRSNKPIRKHSPTVSCTAFDPTPPPIRLATLAASSQVHGKSIHAARRPFGKDRNRSQTRPHPDRRSACLSSDLQIRPWPSRRTQCPPSAVRPSHHPLSAGGARTPQPRQSFTSSRPRDYRRSPLSGPPRSRRRCLPWRSVSNGHRPPR